VVARGGAPRPRAAARRSARGAQAARVHRASGALRRQGRDLLLADGTGTVATVARAVGWGFAWWGTGLYWVAGVMYVVQTVAVVRATRPRVAA
jgi:hypothetical protein